MMKRFFVVFFCACLACALVGCGKAEYLRIHIRAHSNQVWDQDVKLVVRDAVVEYLTPHLVGKTSLAQAVREAEKRIQELERIANGVLQTEGLPYRASVQLCREFFPTRTYGSVTLASGVYDALVIELGEAQGDNWWCIAYPPLCFGGGGRAEVKSWIWEMLVRIFS